MATPGSSSSGRVAATRPRWSSSSWSEELPHFTLERLGSLEAAEGPWRALGERGRSPFSTWEWSSAWCRTVGAASDLSLWLVRDGVGREAALLPLVAADEAGASVLRWVGWRDADLLGPVCAPADTALALSALRSLVAEHCDLFVGHDMDPAAAVLTGGEVVHRWPWLSWELGGQTWEQVLAGRSKNFRKQVRRRRERLDEGYRVTVRMAQDPDRLAADVDLLLALHDAHWGARSRSFAGARAALHREVARGMLERGRLRLAFLKLDGEPAAALYGLRFAGDHWSYQGGRAPGHEELRVGFVLLCEELARAAGDGVGSFLHLRGAEPYKERFADARSTVDTVALALTPRGSDARAALFPPKPGV